MPHAAECACSTDASTRDEHTTLPEIPRLVIDIERLAIAAKFVATLLSDAATVTVRDNVAA